VSDVLDPSVALHSPRPAAASARGFADHLKLATIAVDRTRMPMAVTDPNQPDNPIVFANPAFLNLTGYTANEVVDRNCRFLQGERTSATTVSKIKSAIAEEREFRPTRDWWSPSQSRAASKVPRA
jgi:PAS domain-containing protein